MLLPHSMVNLLRAKLYRDQDLAMKGEHHVSPTPPAKNFRSWTNVRPLVHWEEYKRIERRLRHLYTVVETQLGESCERKRDDQDGIEER